MKDMQKYLVISGSGRSGTNLTLDLLDKHPQTACRNEPYSLNGGMMSALPGQLEPFEVPEHFVADWNEIIERLKFAKGTRDRRARYYKSYYSSGLSRWLAEGALTHPKVQRALRVIRVRSAAEEIYVEPLFDQSASIFPVYKINLRPHWLEATHHVNTSQLILHVVRNPIDVMKSWMNRYVKEASETVEEIIRRDRSTLQHKLDYFNIELAQQTNFDDTALLELQLVRWRYMNEKMIENFSKSPRYRLRTYKEVKNDPLNFAEETFEWVGLEFDGATADRIRHNQNNLFTKPHEVEIDVNQVRKMCRRLMTGSPLERYFDL
ncbi:MAG: sulfotransferase [Pseudomonadota bacterium]